MAVARRDRPVLPQDHTVAEQGEAVSVPVAARRLGRSPDAIRSAIRRGKLQARKGNDGDWRVILPADTPAAEADEADGLLLLVDSLRAELEQERRQLADRQASVEDLRQRVSRIGGPFAPNQVNRMVEAPEPVAGHDYGRMVA